MTGVVAIVGGSGFLGWHVRVLMRTLGLPEPRLVGRDDLNGGAQRLAAVLNGTERLLHLGGVCRGTDEQVRDGNIAMAAALDAALVRCAQPPKEVVYANSVTAGDGTAYGDGKRRAAEVLDGTASAIGCTLRNVALPNLFGEHGRPFHNSVVATFCHQLATGQRPTVHTDRPLDLLHATDAAAHLLDAAVPLRPTTRVGVHDLAQRLQAFAATYHDSRIPHLQDAFAVQLFNTFRSHATLLHDLPGHRDHRGELFEAAKSTSPAGQVFVSTTLPGQTRGHHYHLNKIERFVVLRGTAEIRMRRLLDDGVVRVQVRGDHPQAVDMPVKWTHSITNTGDDELLTLFWMNEIFDPDRPDTYPEQVEPST
jgi:UDP-2-acetamido-2,6-beta-L-arabino-hexul-4-ose reductase